MTYEHDKSKRRRKRASDMSGPAFSAALMPRADVRETDTDYMLLVALPGARKEDVKAEVLGDVLTVSGESSYGPFLRRFALPEGLHTEAVKASFKDGLLTLSLRKPPEFKSRGVSIKVE